MALREQILRKRINLLRVQGEFLKAVASGQAGRATYLKREYLSLKHSPFDPSARPQEQPKAPNLPGRLADEHGWIPYELYFDGIKTVERPTRHPLDGYDIT